MKIFVEIQSWNQSTSQRKQELLLDQSLPRENEIVREKRIIIWLVHFTQIESVQLLNIEYRESRLFKYNR